MNDRVKTRLLALTAISWMFIAVESSRGEEADSKLLKNIQASSYAKLFRVDSRRIKERVLKGGFLPDDRILKKMKRRLHPGGVHIGKLDSILAANGVYYVVFFSSNDLPVAAVFAPGLTRPVGLVLPVAVSKEKDGSIRVGLPILEDRGAWHVPELALDVIDALYPQVK